MDFDFVVVGGGPAGLLLSALLPRDRYRVLLLEAAPQIRRKICGEYLCPKGVELLHSMGLQDLVDGFSVIEGMDLYSPSGQKVETKFPNTKYFGRALRRDVFEQRLLKEAQMAGAEIKFAHRVESIYREDDHWLIRSGSMAVRARYLIGADGRHSIVARSLGQSVRKKSDDRIALHAYVKPASKSTQGEMHLLSSGAYVGLDPIDEKEWNLSFVCDAVELRGIEPKKFLEARLLESASLNGRFSCALEHEEVKVVYPITNRVKAISGKHWALIGDAAGFLDPLTGEGVYQALLSASILHQQITNAKDLNHAFVKYGKEYSRAIREKSVLNRGFQWLLRSPKLLNWIGSYLAASKYKSNVFIGLVGNTISLRAGLRELVRPSVSQEK